MIARQDQITGGLLGLLIGDAVGVPYEFTSPDSIPPLDQIEMTPPADFRRTYPGIAPGTWSDDGAQALCLLASLLDCGRVDPDDLGQRFLNWYQRGYLAIANRVFDVGGHTARVLGAIANGTPILEAGAINPNAKGNGSLMRVLPLVLWHQGSDAELVEAAHLQSRTTHGALTCQVCCALYCLWARYVLHEDPHPWAAAVATLRYLYPARSPQRMELENTIRPDDPPQGEGTGYVVDCLHSARYALTAPSYELVVKRAIALGHDTDTTACVAGGIAGLRDGVTAIPQRWRDQLLGQEIVEPLLEQLLQRWR
ncbi:MAG: ADP-ribosylglycohydrolase family protein [Synechococcales bacterium]|nr:ADP-ribosylglycohydrolase family protein [Synechococcales bacterium]